MGIDCEGIWAASENGRRTARTVEGTFQARPRIVAASFSNPFMHAPHYVTNDPYLASFVLSEGAALAGCTRLGPKKVEFRFTADCHLHNLLRLYWSGAATPIAPGRLFAALRQLKSRSFTTA